MLISRLREGLLCLETPDGKRYIRPTLLQRVQLSWVFRHFHIVPLNVLSRPQYDLVESLRMQGPYVQLRREDFNVELLGTIEYPIHTETRPEKQQHRLADAFTPGTLAPQRVSGRNSSGR